MIITREQTVSAIDTLARRIADPSSRIPTDRSRPRVWCEPRHSGSQAFVTFGWLCRDMRGENDAGALEALQERLDVELSERVAMDNQALDSARRVKEGL